MEENIYIQYNIIFTIRDRINNILINILSKYTRDCKCENTNMLKLFNKITKCKEIIIKQKFLKGKSMDTVKLEEDFKEIHIEYNSAIIKKSQSN